MEKFITYEQICMTADYIQQKIAIKPQVAVILGSGLGSFAEMVEQPVIIPFAEIPAWPISSVVGHSGRLLIGQLEGRNVFVMQGRAHFYEGHSMSEITLPVRVMQKMGIKSLIVTNAAGAINPDYSPGDLMMITDHIGLIGMAGQNPLRGPNLDEFGPRFPDMSQPYDKEFMEIARSISRENDLGMREGVYVSLSGPSFETPADLRFLRVIGADAVGMSTVPEVTIAKHGGMRVLGISGISNKANLDGSTITTHDEVLEAGKVLVPKLTQVISGFLRNYPS